MPVLHVVVPIYNERTTLAPCLDRVVAAPLPDGWTCALWLVDDHSEPAAYAGAEAAAARLRATGRRVALLRHDVNRGKGAALRTGFDAILASSPDAADLVIIQDADLEYDPGDFASLMAPILNGSARVVIGTRWHGGRPLRGLKRRVHAWGNGLLTGLSNLMTGYRVSDMECCYKLMTMGVLRRLRPMLTEDRFGVEPQLVASLARLGETPREVPVRYDPRSFAEGKKIGVRDGLRALWVITRERLRGSRAPDPARDAASGPAAAESIRGSGLLRPRRIAVQLVAFGLGVALLVWCISIAARGEGWQKIRTAPPGLIAGLAACSLASFALNGAIFWLAVRPMRRLRLRDLQRLDLVAAVLNYAPIRLGLVARVAYHLRVDRMTLLQIGAWFAAIGFLMVLALGACCGATLLHPSFDLAWLGLVALALGLGGAVTWAMMSHPLVVRHGRGMDRMLRDGPCLAGGLALRFLDIGAFVGRMGFAAAIIGLDLAASDVLLLGFAALATSLVPLGRVGVREAAVAFVATRLRGAEAAFDVDAEMAALALIESAGEAMVAIPLGALALLWYRRRWVADRGTRRTGNH